MKHFFLGLGTFIIYALLCIYGLHYFVGSPNLDVSTSTIPETSTNLETTPVETVSFDEYIPTQNVDTLLIDSLFEKNERVLDSIFAVDSTAIAIDSSYKEPTVIEDTVSIDTIQEEVFKPKVELKKHRTERFGIFDDLGNKLVACKSYTVIYQNEAKVKMPYACRRYGLVLRDMLTNDPRSSVLVTTYYGANESRTTGEARASYIEKLLNKAGISSQRILSIVTQEDINFKENNIAYGGVRFVVAATYSLKKKVAAYEEVLKVEQEKELSFKKFKNSFENDVFHINNEFTNHVKQLKSYLENHPDKKVVIQSFLSENDGNTGKTKQMNENADLVKTSMLVLGISDDRIEMQPESTDNTEELNDNCILLTIK